MGHVDIGTTMNIYAEVSEAKMKQSMEALSEKYVRIIPDNTLFWERQ